MWKRSIAGESYATSDESQASSAVSSAAWHYAQHDKRGLCPDQAASIDAVQWNELGSVRRDHDDALVPFAASTRDAEAISREASLHYESSTAAEASAEIPSPRLWRAARAQTRGRY